MCTQLVPRFFRLQNCAGAAATVLLIGVISGLVFMGALAEYLQNDILKEAQNWSYEDYDVEKTSYVHYVDSDGNIQLLQQIYTTTDRQPATWDEIPQALVDATVAIEDKRFYEHQGVDWITTVKACANMFFGGDSQFGGSTITQQLVKNTTDEKSITVQRKVMEIFPGAAAGKGIRQRYYHEGISESYLSGQRLLWCQVRCCCLFRQGTAKLDRCRMRQPYQHH